MSNDYRPREHDHLVEPMFGGLGVEDPSKQQPQPVSRPFWRRLWCALARLFRPRERVGK